MKTILICFSYARSLFLNCYSYVPRYRHSLRAQEDKDVKRTVEYRSRKSVKAAMAATDLPEEPSPWLPLTDLSARICRESRLTSAERSALSNIVYSLPSPSLLAQEKPMSSLIIYISLRIRQIVILIIKSYYIVYSCALFRRQDYDYY
jgi:hypothetical protein